MGWIAAAIIFVAVLYKYPKYTLWTALAIAALGAVVAAVAYFYDQNAREIRQAEAENIALTISANGKRCTETSHPLAITVFNRNKFSIDAVHFKVIARNPGHSEELYTDYLESDRILREKEGWSACWALDTYKAPEGKISGKAPSELDWKIDFSYLEKSK